MCCEVIEGRGDEARARFIQADVDADFRVWIEPDSLTKFDFGLLAVRQLVFDLALIGYFDALALAGQHRVIRVVDGDTIIVDYYGKAERVRLLCVDTPESVHPDPSKNEPMGKVASDYAKARLERQSVDLEFEGERQRCHFGRLLAYVFIDRQNFNIELVREGLSPYYTKYGTSRNYDATFRAAEKFARENKKGIWADPGLAPRPPPEKESVVTLEDHYLASRNSQVFHRPNCESVEEIASGNLIEFKTRADATESGRRYVSAAGLEVVGKGYAGSDSKALEGAIQGLTAHRNLEGTPQKKYPFEKFVAKKALMKGFLVHRPGMRCLTIWLCRKPDMLTGAVVIFPGSYARPTRRGKIPWLAPVTVTSRA